MRPRVNVQWGKHGSMPAGWERLPIVADAGDVERTYLTLDAPITLADYNRATFRKLSSEGRRQPQHAIAKRLGWPQKFGGTWEAFMGFSRPVDLLSILDERKMIVVSRWNSAAINQRFLTYNFRPKTEWPPEGPATALRAEAPGPIVSAKTLEAFELPAKSHFPSEMPRYPNVWFHVDASLVASYDAAVALVADEVRAAMRLQKMQGPQSNPEGSDSDFRLEHLQPWEVAPQRALQHAHAFHLRYYHSALACGGLDTVSLPTPSGRRAFYRIPASVHYEVEHTNPNHADVEACPICGRTGDYATLQGNLVELVHDPLGLELLVKGTIRGEVVRFEDGDREAVGGVAPLRDRFLVQDLVLPAQTGDRNTLRIGVVVIAPRPKT